MRIKVLAVVASLLISSPALAFGDPEKPEPTAVDDSKKSDSDRIKCKRIQVTGSLIRRKKCMTVAQWAAMTAAGSAQARTIVDHANQGATSGR
ncbi:hypothetical protein [Sphingorhabdus sp. EL138]|jgi:hypothetical protein|uniref:hypothetical protein n=1 Tax=Sphingorhabdus sp. EL138 TaxID=2073156 RepID=UPI000D68AEA2|nr:hypothetical protein [Sphingorhabdus sp. EL138]